MPSIQSDVHRTASSISPSTRPCPQQARLARHLVLVALLVLLTWGWSGSGLVQAEELGADPSQATWIGWSPMKIVEGGFAFGGKPFVGTVPSTVGHLDWHLIDGQLLPSLTGYLHLTGARNLCGRIRIDYYVRGQRWTTKYGTQMCTPDDGHHAWPVALADYRSDKIDEVRVSIEHLTGMKSWTIVAAERRTLTARHDRVRIAEGGVEFGGAATTPHDAASGGEVLWTWRGAQVSPRITGTLRIDHAEAGCARLRVEYYRTDGARLAEKTGTTMCAPDSGSYSWGIDLDPFSDNKLASITIGLQTLGERDTWRTVGTASVNYVLREKERCGDAQDCLHTASYEIK